MIPLNEKDNTKTIIIPTNETASLITPLFNPISKNITNANNIARSKIFIISSTPLHYIFIINYL